MSRRIAIYGGSFNPIHNGHTSIARAVCETGVVDEVWFMVSPLNPLKKDEAQTILPTDIRLRLADLAVEDVDFLKVSDFETHLPVPSYTYTTLTELEKAYPGCEFSLIVGQDNWERFSRWYKGDEIKAAHDIIVYGRNEENGSQQQGGAVFAQVHLYRKDGSVERLDSDDHLFKLYDISSTQIRNAFKTHDLPFAAKWLHPDVFRHILENALYA